MIRLLVFLSYLSKFLFVERLNLVFIFSHSYYLHFVVFILFYIFIFNSLLIQYKEQKTNDILNLINNKLKITNIYTSILKIFLYFLFFFALFLLLLLRMFGYYQTNTNVFMDIYLHISFTNLVIIGIIFCFWGLCKLFIIKLLYNYILAVYLYYYNKINCYILEIRAFRYSLGFICSCFLLNISSKLFFILADDRQNTLTPFSLRIHYYLKKNIIMFTIVEHIRHNIFIISNNITKILLELRWFIMILVLCYDINHNELYYFYFIMVYYALYHLYIKIASFFYGLVWQYDELLYSYLYESYNNPNTDYLENRIIELNNKYDTGIPLTDKEKQEVNDICECSEKQMRVLNVEKELLEYINTDFNFTAYAKVTGNRGNIRRFLLLSLVFIAFGFIVINPLCIYIVGLTPIMFHWFILPIILIIGICWYYSKRSQIFRIMFWIFSISFCFGIFMLFLINKLPLMFLDKYILFKFTFIFSYSIEQKILFLYSYLDYLLHFPQLSSIDKEYLLHIFKEMPWKEYLSDKCTISTLTEFIHSIIEIYLRKENIEYQYKLDLMFFDHKYIANIPMFPEIYIFFRNSLFITGLAYTFANMFSSLSITWKLLYNPQYVYTIYFKAYSIFSHFSTAQFAILIKLIFKI